MDSSTVADIIVAIHGTYILFVSLGALLVLRWTWVSWIHLPATAWAIWISCTGGICPLTYLEQDLRAATQRESYSETFLEHYLEPVIYPIGLTPEIQIRLGIGVGVFNALLYALIWKRRGRRTRS